MQPAKPPRHRAGVVQHHLQEVERTQDGRRWHAERYHSAGTVAQNRKHRRELIGGTVSFKILDQPEQDHLCLLVQAWQASVPEGGPAHPQRHGGA